LTIPGKARDLHRHALRHRRAPPAALAPAPLSREAFTQNFVAALKAARPGVKIRTIRPLELEIADQKGGIVTGNLGP
jgi:hypothetical protein